MQKLEVFRYATTLYINKGYYNISFFPTSHNMTTIVNEFGKFRYNPLPMCMQASGDIFQAKVDELLVDIKGVKTCTDVILVLRNYCFTNLIE